MDLSVFFHLRKSLNSPPKLEFSLSPEFIMIHLFAFIYICQQIEKTGFAITGTMMDSGRHHCSGGGLNSSSVGELKLYLRCTGSMDMNVIC